MIKERMIYLYCILDSNRSIDFSHIKGIEENCTRQIIYKDISLIFTYISGSILGMNEVLVHENVLEELMKKYDILPMRFNIVVKNEFAVLEILNKNYEIFQKNIAKIRGRVEYGVKVIWDFIKIRENVFKKFDNNEIIKISPDSLSKKYLRKKFEKYKINLLIELEADRYVEEIDSFFKGIISEKSVKKLQTDSLLLNASYLVSKNDEKLFRDAFLNLKKQYNLDFKFLFSGPWPPYSFVCGDSYVTEKI